MIGTSLQNTGLWPNEPYSSGDHNPQTVVRSDVPVSPAGGPPWMQAPPAALSLDVIGIPNGGVCTNTFYYNLHLKYQTWPDGEPCPYATAAALSTTPKRAAGMFEASSVPPFADSHGLTDLVAGVSSGPVGPTCNSDNGASFQTIIRCSDDHSIFVCCLLSGALTGYAVYWDTSDYLPPCTRPSSGNTICPQASVGCGGAGQAPCSADEDQQHCDLPAHIVWVPTCGG